MQSSLEKIQQRLNIEKNNTSGITLMESEPKPHNIDYQIPSL